MSQNVKITIPGHWEPNYDRPISYKGSRRGGCMNFYHWKQSESEVYENNETTGVETVIILPTWVGDHFRVDFPIAIIGEIKNGTD